MKTSKLIKHVLGFLALLLLLAGGATAYAATNDDLATGVVTGSSVSFTGESVSHANVTAKVDGEAVSATSSTESVPRAGDPVVLQKDGDVWKVHPRSTLLVPVLNPSTYGVLWLVTAAAAGSALIGVLHLRYRRLSPVPESDDAPLESSEPAEEPQETSSAATRTSE